MASAAPRTCFQPLLSALAGFRVIRPDLPGAGRSPAPRSRSRSTLCARRSPTRAGHLGVDRAHVVGHSIGTHRLPAYRGRAARAGGELTLFGADRSSRRGGTRRACATAPRWRARGHERGIADQIVAVGARRRNRRRQSRSRSPLCARSICARIRRALPAPARRWRRPSAADHAAHRLPDAAGHRRRGCGRPPSVAQALADQIKGAKSMVAAALRPLDDDREAAGVRHAARGFPGGMPIEDKHARRELRRGNEREAIMA